MSLFYEAKLMECSLKIFVKNKENCPFEFFSFNNRFNKKK